MRIIYLLSVLLLSGTCIFAQSTGGIRGTIMDTAAKSPISDVTVTVLQAKDSSLVTFGRTNKNGAFEIKYLPNGSYRLLATHISYRNYSKNFEITDENREVDAGYVVMNSKSYMLDEVTVMQERAPVTFKNDTIEFNAGSFKTKPNSVVEDLLKKLPGVQVDKDGKIKANGEEVKKILVDGKPFFGNDPKVATKNLPSDVVDKVQVFDKKSDQSQFTRFDDGNSEKTINLTLKPDKKNGAFGRAAAAAGNKDRYQGNFNLNSFKGERQFSAIGMANNTNKQGFTFMDMLNFTGGLGGPGGRGGAVEISAGSLPLQGFGGAANSITTTWAGGLNFNDNWGKNVEISGSYFYNRMQDAVDQKSNRQYLLTNNPFNRLQDAISNRKNESHRLNISADYKIDSFNSLKITSVANLQESVSSSNSKYTSISAKGNLLNSGTSATGNLSNGYSWNNNALWRHRFPKKGRTLSANFSLGINQAESNGRLKSDNSFYRPDGTLDFSDTLDQVNNQENDGLNYGTTISYTEPLSKRALLEFSYNFNKSNTISGKETFDKEPGTGKYQIRNEMLSSDFDNTYTYHRGGMSFRYQQKKYNFSIGSTVQRASLESDFHFLGKDSTIEQSFVNVLPNARLEYNINQYKNFRFSYGTYTRQPSATQLNPIIDNSDPLNIRIGNAHLDQEYNHRLQLNFMSFDPFRKTSFFSMINLNAIQNSIVSDDHINAQGIRTTRPVNADGVYTLNGTLSWGLPVKKIKSNINLNTNATQSKNVNFINGNENKINNLMLAEEISLNYSHKEKLDVTLGTQISFNNVRYSLTPQQNTKYWNQEYSLDVNLYLPKGFSIASEFTFTRNTGYATGFNTDVALWNAGLAKQLFRNKKGELKIQMFDILNENVGIIRNANQNYIEDVYSKILNRYFVVGFTYNLSRFAGKAMPAQRPGNIRVIGEKVRM